MSSSLPIYDAVGISHSMEEGSSRPLILDCKPRDGGPIVPIFTKYIQRPRVTEDHLFRELVGCLLARELGILTAEPCLVMVEPDAADLINEEIETRGYGEHIILAEEAFGYSHISDLMPIPVPVSLDSSKERGEAGRIFSLDLCLQNCDRIPYNPNCGYWGEDVVAFDFEYCLECDLSMSMRGKAYELAEQDIGPEHLFYPGLRKRKLNWDRVQKWALANGREKVASLMAAAPIHWHGRAALMLDFMAELSSGSGELPGQLDWSLR